MLDHLAEHEQIVLIERVEVVVEEVARNEAESELLDGSGVRGVHVRQGAGVAEELRQ